MYVRGAMVWVVELKLEPLKLVKAPRLSNANKRKRKIYAAKMLRRLRVSEGC